MAIDVPVLPLPELDVAQDDEGYSAELSVERDLPRGDRDAVSDACLRLIPLIGREGEHEVRGLVSVDEDTLWVYVHQVGPGRFGPAQDRIARRVLDHLWRVVHEAAAAR